MDLPFLLGTVFTERRAERRSLGYVLHFAFGLVFALVYYAIFRAIGHAAGGSAPPSGSSTRASPAAALVNVLLPGRPSPHGHALDRRRGDAPARAPRVPDAELRRRHGALRRRSATSPTARSSAASPRTSASCSRSRARSAEPLRDGAVELGLVLLGRGLVERRGEVVAQLGEDLGAGLDELLVVAEVLLGARRARPGRTRAPPRRRPRAGRGCRARRGRAGARSRRRSGRLRSTTYTSPP